MTTGGGLMAERRPKGTGSPRWRTREGRWEGRYTDVGGRRRSVYVSKPGAAGRRDCERLMQDRIRQSEAGLRPSDQALAVYVQRWVLRNPELAPQSQRRYLDLIRLHVRDSEAGRTAVIRLQPEHLEDLYADRLANGCAPKTVELIHTILRGALRQAAQRGHAMRDVAALVRPPRVSKADREVYRPPDIERIAGVGDRLSALWTFAFQVPIRESELLGMRWQDTDLDRGTLVLKAPAKGGRPRTLLLPAATVRALRQHRARQAEERLLAAGAYEAIGLVFARLDGNRLDPRRVREQFDRVTAEAGVRRLRFHDIRHSGITHLLESGVPLKVVQEIAGHQSARTTMDTYAHVTETMQQQAVEAMNRAIR